MTRAEAIADFKEEIAIYESFGEGESRGPCGLCSSTYEAMKIAVADMEAMADAEKRTTCPVCGTLYTLILPWHILDDSVATWVCDKCGYSPNMEAE